MRFIALLLFVMMSIQCIGQVEIRGVVMDESGEPLIGANVFDKDYKNGTITDIDGSFILTVGDQSSYIIVSYVGFETKEISISQGEQLLIVLIDNFSNPGCGFGPRRSLLIGGSYDFTNTLGGLNFTNTLPYLINNKPLTTTINYKMGNNGRLTLETRNDINLTYFDYGRQLNLGLEIDYLKNAWFDFDITEGVDYRRFAIIPKLSTRRLIFEAGYINQKELGFFSKSQHGVVAGIGMNTPFGFFVQGRTELLLDEVQYKLRLERYIPALRTSISVDYVHLEDFTSLSLSAQYKMWY